MQPLKNLLLTAAIAGITFHMHGETAYVWRGTVDTVFTNTANWQASPGPAPYGGTNTESRISVYNGSGSPLYYTADLGHTVYQNTTGTKRTLFISNGALYITGGILEEQSDGANGLSNNGDGTLVIDGGTYRQRIGSTVFLIKYGGTGTGTLTVSNGLFDVGSIVYGSISSYNDSGNAILNLDGGTTRVSKIYMNSNAPDGDSLINFNGGILEAIGDETHFLEGLKEANILEGGALIDTAGHSITINQDLLDGGSGGGLTKVGSQTLTLGGTNTFTGNVIVEEGTLRVVNDAALGTTDGSTTVSNGTALELVGNVTITNELLQLYGKTAGNWGSLSCPSGNTTWDGDVLIGLNDTRISVSSGTTLHIGGVIDDGASDYDIEFRGSGTGVTILSGENTYGGKTEVIVATLRLDGGNNRLPVGTQLIIGNGSNVEYATFDLNGYDQEVALLDDLGSTMTNSVIDSAGGGTLTVNDSGNRTFAGNFEGPLTLAKTNSNVLTLSGDMQATSIAVNQGTLQGNATWHCLFNDSDTPNQMIVTGGTLDISSMTFDFDENSPTKSGTYVIVDYSAGGSLTANPSAPFFADAVDMPERGSLRHDTAGKQILLTYGMEGTLMMVN